MVVQHNLTAMNSNRMLNITTNKQRKSTEKLSSGYKINRAADDAAGLSISEKMRKQIRGLTQASLNAQDGISMVQTAEGALGEVHDMLQRMNELAVKSANGTLSSDDRQYIQNEFDQIMSEIDRVAESTKFNEIYVLKGTAEHEVYEGYVGPIESAIKSPDIDNHVLSIYPAADVKKFATTYVGGDHKGQTVGSETDGGFTQFAAGVLDFSDIKNDTDVKKLYGTGFSTTCTACDKFYGVKFVNDQVATGVHNNQSQGGALELWVDISKCKDGEDVVQAVLDAYALENAKKADPVGYDLTTKHTAGNAYDLLGDHHNYIAGKGSELIIFDAYSTSQTARDGFAQQAANDEVYKGQYSFQRGIYYPQAERYVPVNNKVNLHVGADATSNNQIEVELGNLNAVALGLKVFEFDWEHDKYDWVNKADVTTADKALIAIDAVANAIQSVSTQRSRFGAIQNRLEHTIANLDNVVENTTAAESSIRDTDMATEMVKYSNNNILAQAGQAMLAQANQSNQGVLSLLQ